jgi:hypothetical protein
VQDDSSEITYNKETVLFKAASDYLGQKKTISLSYDRNMRIDIFASSEAAEDKLLVSYFVEDLDDIASSEMAKKEDSTTPKVSLSFELSRSHLLTLNKAEVKIDETVVEEVIPEPKKTEATTENDEAEDSDHESAEESDEPEIETLEDLIDSEVEPEYITTVVPHIIAA